ncbi:hypothetical protein MIR68_002545 [Amoeboaphelidium protococcarum]|nr:hypothetical protein MIR68_002545 [Amoeboaphelidium protococcarum]
MATILAQVFGSEKDKYNCAFYNKIGACRHGDTCARQHTKPQFSSTIIIHSLFNNPANDPECKLNAEELQEFFDQFYADFWIEISLKYGGYNQAAKDDRRNPADYSGVVDMVVCENVAEHLVGNIYIRFSSDYEAEMAVNDLNNRFYAGRPIYAELSPVSDFREARCRQHEDGVCNRGGLCNFMHIKKPSAGLVNKLRDGQNKEKLKVLSKRKL